MSALGRKERAHNAPQPLRRNVLSRLQGLLLGRAAAAAAAAAVVVGVGRAAVVFVVVAG